MDIKDFYPSISREIRDKALFFEHVAISEKGTRTIYHYRRSLLFPNSIPWKEKTSADCFDVTMGGYDRAEVCELVGLFILNQLSNIANKEDVGLYRGDGLMMLRNVNSRDTRKNIIKIFKGLGFQIEIVTSLHSVNFLDTTLDLKTGTYRPTENRTIPLYTYIHHPIIHSKS